jgi:2-hydroxy-3-keto-5-methylthiopentenyl-1-phosphate phosphatase
LRRPLAFLCDFDGTVSPRDVGASFVRRFSTAGAARHAALEERWRSGELGHRALTEAECEMLRCTEADALAFVRDFTLDPDFAPFARATLANGDAVCVVSEGFDFYIAALLAREQLGQLPVAANRLRFVAGGVTPEFPFAARSCGRCGNCKAAHVEDWRARGYRTVLIGDGFSDRCAARAADVVLARGSLLEWCEQEGIAVRAAASFAEVRELVRELEAERGVA